MAPPAYLEALRRVVARETRPQRHEINESDEKRGEGVEGLNSSNSSISYPKPPQNRFGRFGRFGRTFSALESHCPDHVPAMRWTQAVEDGRRFLSTWGSQAEAL